MEDVWLFLNHNSRELLEVAFVVVALFAPSPARRLRRLFGLEK